MASGARLVVGRSFERNDARSVDWLHDAWIAQGAAHPAEGGVPIGVVRDDVGEPGVLYALGAEPPSTAVLERFRVRSFFFCPDRGDPITLDDVAGAQRFFAQVPLPITPHTLSWIVHVLRALAPCEQVSVDDNLLIDWQPLEDEQRPALGSMLLGVPAARTETRDQITVRFASRTFTYAKGELSVVTA